MCSPSKRPFRRRFRVAAWRAWSLVKTPQGVLTGVLLTAATTVVFYFAFQRHSDEAGTQLIRSLTVLVVGYVLYLLLVFAWQFIRVPYHMAWKILSLDRVLTATAEGWTLEISTDDAGGISLTAICPDEMDRPELVCFVLDKRGNRFKKVVPRKAEASWGNPVVPWARCIYPEDFEQAETESGDYEVEWRRLTDRVKVAWGGFRAVLQPAPDTAEPSNE